MLAMAIFIDKYKREASADTKDKIETVWLLKWKDKLKNPSRTLCKVMKAYMELLDTTVDAIDEQMCWECWPEDNDVEEVESSDDSA
jgi:hypothetical protein